jgi:hypothetical protein
MLQKVACLFHAVQTFAKANQTKTIEGGGECVKAAKATYLHLKLYPDQNVRVILVWKNTTILIR